MTSPHAQRLEALLREAVSATRVRPPHAFAWFGRGEVAVAASFRPRLTARERAAALARSLASRLYLAFYSQGAATSHPPAFPSPAFDPAWVARLSRANRSRACRDGGWREIGRSAGEAIVGKNGVRVTVSADDVRRDRDARVSILVPRELLRMSPGYYLALGEAYLPDVPLFRVYLNVTPEGALSLLRSATSILNDASVPFRLKVAAHEGAFGRCDSAVLYAPRRDRAAIFAMLGSTVPRLSGLLRPDVPVFTKRVAPGVGLAEEPDTSESFGESRCAILADALIRSASRAATLEHRMRAVRRAFARHGIPLEKSFLNAGSADVYPDEVPRH
ncbi:MAG TPA: T3SS effector HopA1 family protein [Thermoanaerobaculia bacterium]